MVASVTLLVFSLTDSAFLPAILVSDHKVFLLLIGIAVGSAAGFVEELGWAGFVIPRLRMRHGILTTGLIAGFLWGVWHFPAFSGKGSTSDVPSVLYLSVLLFSFPPPFRILMVWLYDRTDSLLMAVIMHAWLSATSLILQPQTTGIKVVFYDLAFASVLWVVVGVVEVVNRGRLDSRGSRIR